jgi:hypothetical protein
VEQFCATNADSFETLAYLSLVFFFLLGSLDQGIELNCDYDVDCFSIVKDFPFCSFSGARGLETVDILGCTSQDGETLEESESDIGTGKLASTIGFLGLKELEEAIALIRLFAFLSFEWLP